MPMTPVEMVEFFRQQAERANHGLDFAKSTSNYQLAAFNCRQQFRSRLMQALITWRIGNDPVDTLKMTVQSYLDGWGVLTEIDGASAKAMDVPTELVSYIAFLVGMQWPEIDVDGFERDRLLDVVLGFSLLNQWDSSHWTTGIAQLQAIGSPLAVETYQLYEQVVHAPTLEIERLMGRGDFLFKARKNDQFFVAHIK